MREETLISLWDEVVDEEYQFRRLSPGLRTAVKDYGRLMVAEGKVALVKERIERWVEARSSGESQSSDDS